MTQTILTGIAIGIFPLLVLAAVFNKLTLSVLKGYVFALMWLQSWPLLYAILNSAMTFYAKQNGAPVVLSEISQIQLKYSDLASTAGYPHVQPDRQYHALLPVYFFLDTRWSGFMGKNKLADVCEWLYLLVVHHAGRHAGFNQVPAGL